MSFARATRERTSRLQAVRALVLCAAVLALVFARSFALHPSDLPRRASVSAQANHGQRPLFDHEDGRWMARPSVQPVTPPPVVARCRVAPSQTIVEPVTDGLHYNRPPPLG
jgi:hypothetical protein